MSRFFARPKWLCATVLAALAAAGIAAAQDKPPTALPGITVTAPRAVSKRAPQRISPARVTRVRETRPARNVARAPVPPPAATAPVAERVATLTVVPNEELRRSGGATLGDLLFSRPGITGSGFAPGAASRPIIRGLEGNRVGIVENGTNAGGVSELGEDHFVPIDPLATGEVQVLRGPEALRLGSTALGGVVSATNNRIPDRLPACAIRSAGCVTAETRNAISTADRGVEGGVLLDAGADNVAVHADAYGRRTSDYSIPGYPYLTDPTRPFNGRQPNSWTQSEGGALGGSYIFDGGFAGAAITQNNSLYAIPGIDGADHKTRIDAHQTKLNLKGEYRPDAAAIAAIRFWAGITDYKHNELGLADVTDFSSFGVRQTFTNQEQEGRVEVQLQTFNARFAAVTTTLGVQGGHQRLTASSPDDPTSLYNGLFSPNSNTRLAGYVFNELQFSANTKAQIAGRIEHVDLRGTTPDFPSDFLPNGAVQMGIARNPDFTPKSGSLAVFQNLPGGLVASVTAQYIERAPRPAELFSRGAHDATATFDIGNPNLTLETARSIEVGLKRSAGLLRFEASAYYTRFSNFIYRRLTGVMCGEGFNSCGNGDPGNEIRQAVYSQRDAVFRGGEFQSALDVAPLHGGIWGIENQFDVVRATFTDGTNVPRIPPVRVGGGLFWRDANWSARVNLLHAFAQNDTAVIGETPTPGYNLLKAEVSYKTALDPRRYGAREMLVGLVGNNLLNAKIRNAVSFTKDEVLLPGASVRAFVNLKF